MQVQRLRSSELAGKSSTSPSASPRGAGKSFDGGPPEKVVRRSSPGGSLLVDVENGAGCSPMPSPAAGPFCAQRACAARTRRLCVEYDKRVALPRRSGVLYFCGPCQSVTLLAVKCARADSPGGGGTGKKWETTTSRFGVEGLELRGNGRQHVQGSGYRVQGSGWEMGDQLQQAGPRSCSPSLPSPSPLCRASRSQTACRVGSWRSQVAACGGSKAFFLMTFGKWPSAVRARASARAP